MEGADAVAELSIPGQKVQPNGQVFPLVLAPTTPTTLSDFVAWIKDNKPDIEERLVDHGVVLFRNFPLSTPQDLLEFINAFGWEEGSYIGGGGPRNIVLGPIHTSTESPADFFINFHHELAYLPTSPSKLFFFCEIPPAKDGETPLLLSNTVYTKIKEVNPAFIENIVTKGVRYTRILEDTNTCERKYQRGWQEIFGTSDREEAAKHARSIGCETIEWLDGNKMKVISERMDGIKLDTRRNEHVFFNSIVLLHPSTQRWTGPPPTRGSPSLTKRNPSDFRFHVTYGDFTEIADDDVLGALETMQQEKVVFQWQKGDAVLVDNNLALHARNPFTAPRRILTAIAK